MRTDLPGKYAALGRRKSGAANDKVKRTLSFAIVNDFSLLTTTAQRAGVVNNKPPAMRGETTRYTKITFSVVR